MSIEYSLTEIYRKPTTLVPSGKDATPLLYSDGLQYSESRYCGVNEPVMDPTVPSKPNPCGTGTAHQNRRVPDLAAAGYAKWEDFFSTNPQDLGWAQERLRQGRNPPADALRGHPGQ